MRRAVKTPLLAQLSPADSMTKAELLEIILNGENSVVEFMNDAVETHRVARELVGFLNSFGGTLLLGVEDDGSISGVTRAEIGEWVTDLCRDKIRPEVIPRIEIIRDVEPGKYIAVVSVEPGYTVHSLWHKTSRGYFIRVKINCFLQKRRNGGPHLRQLIRADLVEGHI